MRTPLGMRWVGAVVGAVVLLAGAVAPAAAEPRSASLTRAGLAAAQPDDGAEPDHATELTGDDETDAAPPAETEASMAAPEEEPAAEAAAESAPEVGLAAAASAVGVTVPAGKNQVAADVLGLGYEQVVRLSGSRVEIVDPVIRGGEVLRSFEAGASSAWPNNGQSSHAPLFYGGRNMSQRMVGHSASRLAVAGTHIYVSNLQTHTSHGRKVADGTVTRRFTVDGVVVNTRVEQAAFAVTSMDGFVWKGREYVAIGLNYSGVRILDVDREGMPDRRVMLSHWMGPHRKGGENVERDQIVEVKFGVDEHGRFIVVAGAMTQEMPALVALEVETEREIWAKNFRPWQNGWEWPEVIEMGPFGPNGRVSLAVGWPTLGHLEVMDAASGHERKRFTGGVASVVRYFTDASGEPRLAFRRGIGNVWDASLARPDPSGTPVVLATVGGDALEWMVPGTRAWSVEVENRSRSEIGFRASTGASRAAGCWRDADLHGATNPLPTRSVSIPAAGKAGPYLTGQKVWGDPCRDNPGVFYVQVEPADEPAHRQVVQIHADAQGIRIAKQTGGGRFSVQVETTEGIGARLVIAEQHGPVRAVGAPVIEATRLTPAEVPGRTPTDSVNDPSRPVHRFTVSGVTWEVPGADAGLAEATLPLPFAEGSVDGERWDRLGTVASPLAPTMQGSRVAAGTAVFDWQTAPGASSNYRYFRVNTGATTSNVIDVKPLPAPAPTDVVGGTGTGISITGAGVPRANGLDQAPMRVTLFGKSQALDVIQHAALYQRIYYRDTGTKALITGLGDPKEPNQLVMFSLRPGQYANDGLNASSTTSIGVFFSAKYRQQDRQVMAVIKPNGANADAVFGSAALRPATNALAPNAGSTGAGGVSVGSCLEGACALANPKTAPAMHSLAATTIGVQFRTAVVPGSSSLPLAQEERNAEEHALPSDAFEVNGSRATLRNPSLFGASPTVTGQLVTHGERIALENLYVKAR